jgi:hypothetical protein
MVNAGIERRDELRYCALPTTLLGAEVPRQVREAYQALDTYLGERNLEDRGPSIIRYRRRSEEGPLDVVVGWHNGPYSRIAETTREIIAWGDDQGVTWETDPDAGGDRWASWFELYLTEPSYGPEGPRGSVEVCVGIRDEPRQELRPG